jgi:hypothetical protein
LDCLLAEVVGEGIGCSCFGGDSGGVALVLGVSFKFSLLETCGRWLMFVLPYLSNPSYGTGSVIYNEKNNNNNK